MATSLSITCERIGWAHDARWLLGFARRVGLVRCGTNLSTFYCGDKMTMTWNNDLMTVRLRALLMVLLFVALASWEDAAQDQYDRMHDDAGGAGCAMWIDYGK